MAQTSTDDRRWVRSFVAVVAVVAVAVALVAASVAASNGEPSAPDVCEATGLLLRDGEHAFAVAAFPDVTAGEVRQAVEVALGDLARLSDALPDRFESQILRLRQSVLEIRQSLVDLGDETPYEEGRRLVDDAVEDAVPVFLELLAGIETLCPGLEV